MTNGKPGTEDPNASPPANWVWIVTAIAFVIAAVVIFHLECNTDDNARTIQIYTAHSPAWRAVIYGSGFGAVFATFCILFGIHFLHTGDANRAKLWGTNVSTWKAIFLVPWIIVPPAWFCAEYFDVYKLKPVTAQVQTEEYKRQVEERRDHFEQFLHGQENAGKVWLAMVTVLGGLYVGSVRVGSE